MFMHRNAKCLECDRVFCCSVHCADHKKKCSVPAPKRGFRKLQMASHSHNNSSNRTIPAESGSEANNYTKRKDTPRLSRKRKLGNSLKLYNPHHVAISPLLNLPINRKKLVAVRNKYKKMISPMQTIKEEEEPMEPIVTSTINVPSNIEAYKTFQIGSLKDSPIVATTPVHLMVNAPGILPKLENDVKTGVLTSTPNELSSNVQPYKLINKIGPSGDISNICCSTPKEATEVPPLPANHDNANIPPENINIAKVTALVSPILAEVTPSQNSMSKRKMADSPWESENATYYTAKSFFSPQYSSLGTPMQNPSLFTSVKDAFRNFVCLLPGTSTDEAQKICSSPLKKRSKQTVLSPIRCRPTFRGRYQENTSSNAYFSLQHCSKDKLSFTKQ